MAQIKQLPVDDRRLRGSRAHAGAENVGAADLRRRIGFDAHVTNELYPGVDLTCEAYACRVAAAFVFGVLRSLDGDAAGRVEVWTHRADQIPLVELALDLPDGWLSWRSELGPESPRPWHVVRQDDNGNRFVMVQFAEEDDAGLYARLMNERIGAHKQFAFVERR